MSPTYYKRLKLRRLRRSMAGVAARKMAESIPPLPKGDGGSICAVCAQPANKCDIGCYRHSKFKAVEEEKA